MSFRRLARALALSSFVAVAATATPALAADKYCGTLKGFKSDFDKFEKNVGSADPTSSKGLNAYATAFDGLSKSFKKLEKDTPSPIKNDIKLLSGAFQTVAKEFSKLKDAKITDLEKLVPRLEAAGKSLDDPKFDKAGDKVTAWVKKNCPGLDFDLDS